jgi:adenylate cyclase
MEAQPCQATATRESARFGNSAVSETRKLAAIMAVDVVGYSRLMSEDEAGTAKAVREHRRAAVPVVARPSAIN